MSFSLVSRQASHFVGLPWTGPYAKAAEIPLLWRQFGERLHELDASVGRSRYVSPCHARRSEFTVYVGVEAPQPIAVPDGMVTFLLLPQRYAQFAHQGPMAAVTQTYSRAFAQLREHGVRRDLAVLWLELYDDRYVPFRDAPECPGNACDILLAIE